MKRIKNIEKQHRYLLQRLAFYQLEICNNVILLFEFPSCNHKS